MGRRLILLVLAMVGGCNQTPPSCPQEAPSAPPVASQKPEPAPPLSSAEVAPIVSALRKCPQIDPRNFPRADADAKAWLAFANSCKMHNPSYNPPPNAPRFIPEGKPDVWGMGVLQLDISPNRKASGDRAMALRALLVHYQGKEWNPHLTILPWFGGKQSLVFNDVWAESAAAMCLWLDRLGWVGYGDGIPGVRTCTYHHNWYDAKP